MLALLAAAPHPEATATTNAAPAGESNGRRAHQPGRDQVNGTPPRRLAERLIAGLSVPGGVISPRRAAILVANVVLPLAAAWALRHDDAALGARARAVYSSLPGLPSNQITRAMIRQLGLSRSPAGACAQQGLQHLWAHHCREKQCGSCPCAGPAAPPLPRGIYCEA
ncbi:MAG TPA: hypothetical protein VF916_00700 [Ktedonobacterales bacterium]|jgi:hypothetical protein